MKVTLISHSTDPIRTVARACWICTHAEEPTEADMANDKAGPLVRRVIASGHDSVLEHASFSFAIDGISRACSHQLVRHRLASYSQQSQRYVTLDPDAGEWYITPPNLERNADYHNAMRKAGQEYQQAMAAGVPAEDARFLLPNAAKTRLVLTMNARELRHFFSLRCCNRAQWEIRELANEMLDLCRRAAPVLFKDSGPACLTGKCPEGTRSCGEPWRYNR